MTKDVSQIRDATIYDRPMSESSTNTDMEEFHTLQFINFSSITVRQRSIFPQPLPIRISLDIIINVTCKLPRIFMMIPLIIPFDRGGEYG